MPGVGAVAPSSPPLPPKPWLVLITQPWEALVFARLSWCSGMGAPVPVGDPEPSALHSETSL